MHSKSLRAATLAAILLSVPVAALAQNNNTTGTNTADTATARDRDNRGFDWGWLGLFGLIGLAGLMKRDRPTVRTTTTPTGTNRV